jgi:hypothetical protein
VPPARVDRVVGDEPRLAAGERKRIDVVVSVVVRAAHVDEDTIPVGREVERACSAFPLERLEGGPSKSFSVGNRERNASTAELEGLAGQGAGSAMRSLLRG